MVEPEYESRILRHFTFSQVHAGRRLSLLEKC